MKTILLFGAGKSSTSLIEYLGNCCDEKGWSLLVCDADLALAQTKIRGMRSAEAVSIDVSNDQKRADLVSKADLVISMLPPTLHFLVAKDCVAFGKHLLTASYLDDDIKLLKNEIENKGLMFLGEMGLDPGIDHMSAMSIIHDIRKKEGKVTSFKSHCGGLVSPESDDNPWHYKITWNPANVVMAGSSGAVYRQNGQTVHLLYEKIFADDSNRVDIPALCNLAWYANRDSLAYIKTYKLDDINTFIRTTLRYPSFCRGWNKIIKLGLTQTDDHKDIEACATIEDWFNLKKEKIASNMIESRAEDDFFNDEFLEQLNYLSVTEPVKIPEHISNSASLLQYLLEKRLVMKSHDKDMIVMLHEIEYELHGEKKRIASCLVVKGEDQLHTAMAKTVGLPLGIAAKLILERKIQLTGLHIPVLPEIYEPVLKELALNGIVFTEENSNI